MSDAETRYLPLRQWRLENFKSVQDAVIDFKPLTVLVGANSSGKSTVLQSILLVVQAAQSGSQLGVLGLNGPLVSLGTFEDVRNSQATGKVKIGGTFSVPHGAGGFASKSPLMSTIGRFTMSGFSQPPRFRADKLPREELSWLASFSPAEGPESGSAMVRTVDLDGFTRRPGSNDRMGVRISLARTGHKPVLAYSGRDSESWSHVSSDDVEMATYRGAMHVGQPPAARKTRLDAAAFAGPFPVGVAVKRPQVAVAVEQWITKCRVGSGFLPDPVSVDSSIVADGNAWRSQIRGEIVSALVEALSVARDQHGEDPLWPWELLAHVGGGPPVEEGRDQAIDAIASELHDLGSMEMATEEMAIHEHYTDVVRETDPRDGISEAMRHAIRIDTVLGEARAEIAQEVVARLGDESYSYVFPDEPSGRRAMLSDRGRPITDVAADTALFLGQHVYYLGPLREDPRVVYRRPLTPGSGALGTKGEFTAGVLVEQASRVVSPPLPDPAASGARMELRQALKLWLQFFELADEVDIRESSVGPVFRIRERSDGPWLHLTNVGVGVSQLLPVLVLCLMAEPGSLILLEQPELHLHPGLQQKLGDFLLRCAESGRQMIVETHSEHIVSRLRLRIACSDEADVVDQVGIIYAARTDGVTHYCSVKTNEYGGIDEWPPGFFDQSPKEAQEILRAALRKRQSAAAAADT